MKVADLLRGARITVHLDAGTLRGLISGQLTPDAVEKLDVIGHLVEANGPGIYRIVIVKVEEYDEPQKSNP